MKTNKAMACNFFFQTKQKTITVIVVTGKLVVDGRHFSFTGSRVFVWFATRSRVATQRSLMHGQALNTAGSGYDYIVTSPLRLDQAEMKRRSPATPRIRLVYIDQSRLFRLE